MTIKRDEVLMDLKNMMLCDRKSQRRLPIVGFHSDKDKTSKSVDRKHLSGCQGLWWMGLERVRMGEGSVLR